MTYRIYCKDCYNTNVIRLVSPFEEIDKVNALPFSDIIRLAGKGKDMVWMVMDNTVYYRSEEGGRVSFVVLEGTNSSCKKFIKLS